MVGAIPARTRLATPRASGPVVPIAGSFSLVLPAHNEEENISLVATRALTVLPRFTDQFEIIIVNDGSRDATGRIADELAASDARVQVVHHRHNRGYGAALRSGFDRSTGDHVMFMDADRQFDIADLALLSPFVDAFDIVAGFRMERNDPIHRRIFAEIFNVTVRILFGVHLRDIDCAFKVFDGALLRSLTLSAPGALINTEIQAKARRQGARMEQVGVHHFPRVAGAATGGSWRVILRAMWETVALWWSLHHYQPPKSAPQTTGPHRLGDAAVTPVSSAGVAAAVAIVKRFLRNR